MLVVEYWPEKAEMRVTGHAGYAPKGQDIVCAAASMLIGTLHGYLIDKPGFESSDDGTVYSVVCAVDGQVQTAMDMCYKGYEMLEKRYPANVICGIRK